MTAFALVSAHATVLAGDPVGGYDHVYHEDAGAVLAFGEDGRPSSDVPAVFGAAVALPNPERFAFRTGDGFLTADPDGGFRSSAALGPWEVFTRVPLAALSSGEGTPPALPRKARRHAIPRLLHQTRPSPLPPEFAAASDHLRAANPGWTHVAYSAKDQHDFIYDYFGWDVLRAFLRINPRYGAARADLFRYLCLYQRGGVYLDAKSTTCRPGLSDILRADDEFVLCQWDNGVGRSHQGWGLWPELRHVPGGEYQTWHVIAAPGHPFLEAVILATLRKISSYDPRLDGVGRTGTLRTTGPIMYTRVIHPLLTPNNHRFLDATCSGLVYSAVERHHEKLASHYSVQTTPVIL